jgi:hypothetical protein
MSATKSQFVEHISQNIFPKMEEAGVDGCVIAGYYSDETGRQCKFSLLLGRNGKVSVQDGLIPLAQFAAMWCAPPAEFGPPAKDSGSGAAGAPT